MKVFLTGGSGYVGTYVTKALLKRGHEVRALQHREPPEATDARAHAIVGSVTDPDSLRNLMNGCDAVVHLVGIIDESPGKGLTYEALHDQATRNVVQEARSAGIQTFVHMSANGARADGVSAYQTSKWRAEQHVAQGGFSRWTIFRPSIVFGDPGPDNIDFATRLAKQLILPFPVLPVFGDGKYGLQPIHATDLAEAFAQALGRDEPGGMSYAVGGHEKLTYLEVLDRLTEALGKEPKPKLHQPVWLVRPIIRSVGKLGLLPISIDQFEMLLDGNTCDSSEFYRDFEVSGIPFTVDNLAYLKERA